MGEKSHKVLFFLAAAQVVMLVPVGFLYPEKHANGIFLGCLFAEVSIAAT